MSIGRVISGLGLAVMAVGPLTIGCEEDPVGVEDRIVIQLSGIKESDINSGTVQKSKNVTTETSNPYGAFLQDARQTLGRDPSRIGVTMVQITLAGDSRGVASFGDLFNGTVEVFLDADVGGTVPVARVSAPGGSGPIDLELVSDEASLAPILAALLATNFRVGIRGATPRTGSDDFDARIDVRIGFAAYE